MPIQLITKNAEVKLVELLNAKRQNASGWQAIHFHLSELLEEYKSEYQAKIAINLINDLLKNYDGNIFLLSDNSIIAICQGLPPTIKEKLVFQLRYLYMDDPLAYTEMGQENPAFCTMYDLKHSWNEFYAMCSRRMTMLTRKPGNLIVADPEKKYPDKTKRVENNGPVLQKQAQEESYISVEMAQPGKKIELSASKLALIERDLRAADLYRVVRRQPVCAILADMKVRRVFDELYIHINHLRQMLKSDVDFLSNRWLFKYLTHILDERMIELIKSNPQRYLDSPISINLNVETLLSSWFTAFDAIVKPAMKVSIVIEVPVVDVFADMAAFMLARAEVQKLGYRVCLDGLTTASLASISREKLGLDLVKVQWNADMQSDLTSRENLELMQAIQTTGSNRVILCRCDNKSAVEYGQALGISLFQGRYIDSVFNPTAKIEN